MDLVIDTSGITFQGPYSQAESSRLTAMVRSNSRLGLDI